MERARRAPLPARASQSPTFPGRRWLGSAVAALCLATTVASWGADTNAIGTTNQLVGTNATATNLLASDATLRSHLELQGKLHSTLLAIEAARQEANAASLSNAAMLSRRLEQLEQTLEFERERERTASAHSNRTLLLAGAVFGGLGVLALAITVFFQVRGMNRFAEMAAALPASRAWSAALALPAQTAENHLPARLGPEASGGQLLQVIERLERRIKELEATTHAPASLSSAPSSSANPLPSQTSERVTVLMGKADSWLTLGDAPAALACAEEALQLEPKHLPAWLVRGKALERMKRHADALEAYDHALEIDPGHSTACVLKAGVLSHLNRPQEALACYEQALKLQTRS